MNPNPFSASSLRHRIHGIPDDEAGPSNRNPAQLRQSTATSRLRLPTVPSPWNFCVWPTDPWATTPLLQQSLSNDAAAFHLPVGPTEPPATPILQQIPSNAAAFHIPVGPTGEPHPLHQPVMAAGDSSIHQPPTHILVYPGHGSSFPPFPGPSTFQRPQSHGQNSEDFSILYKHIEILLDDNIRQKRVIYGLQEELISSKSQLGKLVAQVTRLMEKLDGPAQ